MRGDIEPAIPYNHMGLTGHIPKKCAEYSHLFEGGCLRAQRITKEYLYLDYGFCGIVGKTDPVLYENPYILAKVTVPRKCTTCQYLDYSLVRHFYCRKDQAKWNYFPRSLDWGTWKPDKIYIDLPLPKITTSVLWQYVIGKNFIEFIKEYRRINPNLSLKEAKQDYNFLKNTIND
jgi:hypothetical protein